MPVADILEALGGDFIPMFFPFLPSLRVVTRCLCAAAILLLGLSSSLFAEERPSAPVGPVDIYLTEGRVCKKCVGRWLNGSQVELVNRQGLRGVYRSDEIVGVDRHPIARKLLMKSIYGQGLPGRVLFPRLYQNSETGLDY